VHLPRERTGVFSWMGHTWRSWYALLVSRNAGIADHFLWNFPQVPPAGKKGGRPRFGKSTKPGPSAPRRNPPRRLPRAKDAETTPGTSGRSVPPAAAGSETVFVVEDEPEVRKPFTPESLAQKTREILDAG